VVAGNTILAADLNQLVDSMIGNRSDQTYKLGNDLILPQVGPVGAPTVTPTGGTGATTYSYQVVAVNAHGDSVPSTTTTITNGVASLSSSTYNLIGWTQVQGATSYKIIRTAGGGSTGLLATVAATQPTTGTMSYQDQGASASVYTASTKNYTGVIGIGSPAPGYSIEIIGNQSDMGILISNTGTSGRNWLLASSNSGGVATGAMSVHDLTSGLPRLSVTSTDVWLPNGQHLKSTGTAPTLGALQGGINSQSISGTDVRCQVSLTTTGAAPGAASQIAIIVFAASYGSVMAVVAHALNAVGAGSVGTTGATSAQVGIVTGTVGLSNTTNYVISFINIG
jgi:hypothetical protein